MAERRALFYRSATLERVARVAYRALEKRAPSVLRLYQRVSPVRLVRGSGGFGDSLISAADLDELLAVAESTLGVPGDFIELGVYKGGSLWRLAQLLRERGADKLLFGLDTFTGQPDPPTAEDRCPTGTPFFRGVFHDTDLVAVRRSLAERGLDAAVRLVAGPFVETLPTLADRTFAFAHVDCDTYANVGTCIAHLRPCMSPGGVIYFDDYASPLCPGARRAVTEAFGAAVTRCGSVQACWRAPA